MSQSTSTPHNLFTIGHSNHAWERFTGLLSQHQVEVFSATSSGSASR